MTAGPLVEAHALTKEFGGFVAVDGIDFAIRPGEAFGFLGPNGAGKSSTMRMIGCVSPVTSGELRVLGLDPKDDGPTIRGRIGVVPQEDNHDTELTVWDNLLIYGRYFDLPRPLIKERAEELLDFVQLTDRRDSKVDPLSGGMKRRLTIARALINQPELLLLDEPTTGLDPQARHLVWERLYRLKQTGTTLVLTTHYMDEAEQLCDRLVIMDRGRIVAEGAPRNLIAEHATREVVEVRFETAAAQTAALPWLATLADRVEPLADRVVLYAEDGDRIAAKIDEAEMRAGRGARAPRQPRRRVLDPHGPHARRGMSTTAWRRRPRSTPPMVRVLEREFQVYRRLWRGNAASMFLNPALFLAAMGLGLGGLIDESSGSVGGVSYLDFVAPGLMIASSGAARGRRIAVAGGRRREVAALLPRHGRDTAAGARRVRRLRDLERDPRHVRRDGLPRGRRRARCDPVRLGRARDPRRRAHRRGLLRATCRVLDHAGDRLRVPDHHAARDPAALPVLGHVLPGVGARMARAARLPLTALARRLARPIGDDR